MRCVFRALDIREKEAGIIFGPWPPFLVSASTRSIRNGSLETEGVAELRQQVVCVEQGLSRTTTATSAMKSQLLSSRFSCLMLSPAPWRLSQSEQAWAPIS